MCNESSKLKKIPFLGIPMMSDEKWHKIARENAVYNYRKIHGRGPESVEIAVAEQHEFIRQIILEHEGIDVDTEPGKPLPEVTTLNGIV